MTTSTEHAAPDTALSLRRLPAWYRAMFSADLAERFSFYGLQAVLVLYAAAPRASGGLGLDMGDAAALFGAWIAVTFTLSLPGGWIGDRLLGARRAMLLGCVVSAAGLALLAVPAGVTGAVGLCVLAVGGGLFKPNQEAVVNLMFAGARERESGISLMYVATQISALGAPVLIGLLGERVNWSVAFLTCALAVLLAGVRVAFAVRHFGEVGAAPGLPLAAEGRRRLARRTTLYVGVPVLVVVLLMATGVIGATTLVSLAGLLCLGVSIGGYVSTYRINELTAADRRRLRAFLAVLLGTAAFWAVVAHAGSLLNLFARDHVDRSVAGFVFPASWLQSVTPLLILLLAPVLAVALPRIGGRNRVAVKFSIALLLVGGGFMVMALAVSVAATGPVSPLWLVAVYLTAACGEVVIAAVAIAATVDVLPRAYLGRMLGLFWLFSALGAAAGSGLVRLSEVIAPAVYYLTLGGVALVAGAAFAVFRTRLTRSLAPAEGPDYPDRKE
ncbi:oligopeptide:H+ symporter [Amycolatopsis ultiminotia]|uniref:Oligopeptide:H+ symporter n=1 Tax=Amycolatopsis ultiminotia TaxID=543629 RepID=A0ABP6YH93_9PSEU